MIELRKPKLGNGGIGGGGIKNKVKMKRSGKLRQVGKTKRGREQRIFDRFVRPVVIQETAEATGIDIDVLNSCECDHLFGRDATGFEPLGAMMNPLNLQMLDRRIHALKTNAPTKEGQRMDFRDTSTQERMKALTERLIAKIGPAPTLNDIRDAYYSEMFKKDFID